MSSDFDIDRIKSFLVTKNIKLIKDALTAIDTNVLEKEMTDQIKKRTRLGKDKDNIAFVGLKSSTEKTRLYAKKRGVLSGQTQPKKSNQTFTGQMVDAVLLSVEKTVKSLRFYGGLISSRNDGKTNEEVYKHNVNKGRDFYGLAPFEENKIKRLIREMWKKHFDKK